MRLRSHSVATLLALAVSSVAAAGENPLGLRITPSELVQVDAERVGRTQFIYTFRVRLQNSSDRDALNVTATVSSTSSTTVVKDGGLTFGDVPAFNTLLSHDTFSVQQNRAGPFDPSALSFELFYQVEAAEMAVVPQVVSLSQTDASSVIDSAGLTVGAVSFEFDDTVAEGSVIAQSPPADSEVPPSSGVDLVVSYGPEVVLELPKPYVDIPRGGSLLVPVRVRPRAGYAYVSLDPDQTKFRSNRVIARVDPHSLWLEVSVEESAELGGPVDVAVVAEGPRAVVRVPLHVRVVAERPLSQTLIVRALDEHRIDLGTSLLYRYYARFGDVRLPAEYRGGGSLAEDPLLDYEASRAEPSLSAEVRAALQPFQLRPDEPGSSWGWVPATIAGGQSLRAPIAVAEAPPFDPPAQTLDQSIERLREECFASDEGHPVTERHPSYPLRVHAYCTGVLAENINALDSATAVLRTLDAMWVPATGLMGDPLPDGDRGGDDAVDVYVVTPSADLTRDNESTLTVSARGSAFQESGGISYLLLKGIPEVASDELASVAIHEFFHVLQARHFVDKQDFRCNGSSATGSVADCSGGIETGVNEEWWFSEASASWAETHFARLAPQLGLSAVSRSAYEVYFRNFVERSTTLTQSNFLSRSVDDENRTTDAYNASLWPLFVELETGSASFMHDIWHGLAGKSGFDELNAVVDQVFSFSEHWKEFSFRNMNMELPPDDLLPLSKRYHSLDPAFPDNLRADTSPGLMDEVYVRRATIALAPLHTIYRSYISNGVLAKELVFDLSQLIDEPGVEIQALIWKPSTGWKREDLTGRSRVNVCIPDQGEPAVDVALIISNKDRENVVPEGKYTVTSLPVRTAACACPLPAGDYCFEELSPGSYIPAYGSYASVGLSINSAGTVAGYAQPELGALPHGASWVGTGRRIYTHGNALDINDADELVGWAFTDVVQGQGPTRAVLWRDGQAFDLATVVGVSPEESSESVALNELGTMVGTAWTPPPSSAPRALIWKDCAPNPITALFGCASSLVRGGWIAVDVNEKNRVLLASGAGGTGLMLNLAPEPGEPAEVPLSFPAGTAPIALNDRGEILVSDSQGGSAPFVMVPNGSPRILACQPPGCVATGLSNRGEAVGFANGWPVRWDRTGKSLPLPREVFVHSSDPYPSFDALQPTDINETGEISGTCWRFTGSLFTHYWNTAFRLTPLGH